MTELIHKILHGDSRGLALLFPYPINCIITDPPYGIKFESNSAELPSGKRFTEAIQGDGDLDEALDLFGKVMTPLVAKLVDDADVYIFTKWSILQRWIEAVSALGLKVTNVLVWDKGTPGMGDVMGNWGNSHEFIIYAKKGRRAVRERRSSIISVNRVDNKTHIHPTQKPVDLIEILVRQSTSPGDLVVDPFSGSGSTVVACKNLGRNCIGIELDEQYIKPSRERLTVPSLL